MEITCSLAYFAPAFCKELTLQRIAVAMSTSLDDIVMPVKTFVAEMLPKPLILHEVPRNALASLTTLIESAQKRTGGRIDVADILSTVKDALDVHLPFPWIGFASDVGAAYAAIGHFPEKTQEAGQKPNLTMPTMISNS